MRVLDFLIDRGDQPLALLIPDPDANADARALRDRCAHLDDGAVFVGTGFRADASRAALRGLDLEYVVSVHFPYLFRSEDLAIPSAGVLNLHPAYLPWNRGWHTPTWAILDGTPAGATLHYVDEGVDSGDIVARRQVEVRPDDTAHTLYQRLLDLEFDLFCETWPAVAAGTAPREPQRADDGTTHRRADLDASGVRRLDRDAVLPVGEVLDRLRALTTNDPAEAAYVEVDGTRYAVRVAIDRLDVS